MIYLFSSCSALCNCHLLKRPLHLDQVEGLAANFNGWLQDRLYLAEFVLVAGDEVHHVCCLGCHDDYYFAKVKWSGGRSEGLTRESGEEKKE